MFLAGYISRICVRLVSRNSLLLLFFVRMCIPDFSCKLFTPRSTKIREKTLVYSLTFCIVSHFFPFVLVYVDPISNQHLHSFPPQGLACNCIIFFLFFSVSVDGVMRTMNTEKLIKTLPIIQNQLDALLDFQVSAASTTLLSHFTNQNWNRERSFDTISLGGV